MGPSRTKSRRPTKNTNKKIREKFEGAVSQQIATQKPKRGADARPAPPCTMDKTVTVQYGPVFVGVDLHKEFLQVAVVDSRGELLLNKRVENTMEEIRKEFSMYPKNAKYVIESSSVYRAVYRFMTEEMGLDVVLSNPYQTWLIAKSKNKTDKRDAHALADLLKSKMIQTCYVPPPDIMEAKDTVRQRKALSQMRASCKIHIHSILLQNSIKIPGTTFTTEFNKKLRELKDWRIDEYLDLISTHSRHIKEIDAKLEGVLKQNQGAQLLKTIPGVGTFTAVAVVSALGDVSRFHDADRVVSYAGLAPSERSSGGIVKHGRITRMGDKLLRWVLVEAAHTHVMRKRDSPHVARHKRIAKKRGNGKAAVTTAAHLLRMMYRMLTDNITYDEYVRRGVELSAERAKAKSKRASKPRVKMSDLRKTIKERDDEIARLKAELAKARGGSQ